MRLTIKRIGLVAGSIGIIQGVIWTVLSIVGIFEHFLTVDLVEPSQFTAASQALLYALQVSGGPNVFLNGTSILIILIVYLVISLIWLGVSVLVILGVNNEKQFRWRTAFICWGALAIIICIHDLIATILLSVAYAKVKNSSNNVYLLIAYALLFSLAARGYVIWIINLVVSIFIIIQGKNKTNQKTQSHDDISNMINAFDDRSKNGEINQAFNFTNGRSLHNEPGVTSRTQSPSEFSLGSIPRIARINRLPFRNRLQNIPPPRPPSKYVYPPKANEPRPDYSPTNQLRPVLKNVSNTGYTRY